MLSLWKLICGEWWNEWYFQAKIHLPFSVWIEKISISFIASDDNRETYSNQFHGIIATIVTNFARQGFGTHKALGLVLLVFREMDNACNALVKTPWNCQSKGCWEKKKNHKTNHPKWDWLAEAVLLAPWGCGQWWGCSMVPTLPLPHHHMGSGMLCLRDAGSVKFVDTPCCAPKQEEVVLQKVNTCLFRLDMPCEFCHGLFNLLKAHCFSLVCSRLQ